MATPSALIFSISASSAQGSTTTPLPMTESLPCTTPGRQQRQLVSGLADDERMTGIVAALEAHHDIGAMAEPVDDLAFAFVAPLGADHHDCGHLDTNPHLPGETHAPFDRCSARRLGQFVRDS